MVGLSGVDRRSAEPRRTRSTRLLRHSPTDHYNRSGLPIGKPFQDRRDSRFDHIQNLFKPVRAAVVGVGDVTRPGGIEEIAQQHDVIGFRGGEPSEVLEIFAVHCDHVIESSGTQVVGGDLAGAAVESVSAGFAGCPHAGVGAVADMRGDRSGRIDLDIHPQRRDRSVEHRLAGGRPTDIAEANEEYLLGHRAISWRLFGNAYGMALNAIANPVAWVRQLPRLTVTCSIEHCAAQLAARAVSRTRGRLALSSQIAI